MSDDYQYVTKNYVDNAINSGGTVLDFQPELSYELNPQTNTVNDTSYTIMKWKNSGYNLTLTNIKLFKSYDNVSFTEAIDNVEIVKVSSDVFLLKFIDNTSGGTSPSFQPFLAVVVQQKVVQIEDDFNIILKWEME
eukprot:Awhi_evm1s1319